MKTIKNEMDMTHGPLAGKILRFAVPLALSSMLQQLFNAADLAVVGRFTNPQAMAAVGSNASVISLLISLFVGLSVGANVVVGNLIGAGVTSPYSLYNEQTASFGEDDDYNQADSAGFINLFGLPVKVRAQAKKNWNL